MIARIWTASTTRELMPAYADYLRREVFAELQETEGYRRAVLLERATPDGVEIQVVTFWDSLESIRLFAGEDVERAVVTETAAAHLTAFDDRARHFEVVLSDGA